MTDRLSWRHAARTDIGRVRAHNEDSLLAAPETGYFAVADGLGGHVAGEVASELAVRRVDEELGRVPPNDLPERIHSVLHEAIRSANEAILEEVDRDPGLAGMGTTLTILAFFADRRYAIGHVGDSRAYLLRDGELRRLTHDHTVVQELVDRGRLTDEQARLHPRSSVLTRALGIERDVVADYLEGAARAGDRFLLATDGLTAMVEEAMLRPLLETGPDPGAAAEALVDAACRAGGTDNITVIVVELDSAA
ncbi:MAG: Stp1/IreP family PP2C-type Ser/Thr phosphatase [Gemmatimonadota bacterium]